MGNHETTFNIDEEVEAFAAAHASDRNSLHKSDQSTNTWGIEYDQTDEIGVLGEAAFASYYRLPFDGELRPSGDDGIDFIVEWCGLNVTIDLKSTKYLKNPHLLVRANKEHHADLFVLIAVDAPIAKLYGWLPRHQVVRIEPSESKYGHKNYKIHNSKLNDMPTRSTITEPYATDQTSSNTPHDQLNPHEIST